MDKIILIGLLVILLYFYINRGNQNESNAGLLEDEPSQKEIQKLDYRRDTDDEIVQVDELGEFPTPQLSRSFKKLSKKVLKPFNNVKDFFPNKKNPAIIRDVPSNMVKERVYFPGYFRKDRLSGNDIGTEELRPFTTNDEPDNSWTDKNVSHHPKFYTSEIKDELTNVGSFFNKNNQYNDKTSSNTDVLPSDSCYIDKMGMKFCEDNTRLQNIPPSLISDINKCYALNTVGMYKDKGKRPKEYVSFNQEKIDNENLGVWSYADDRVINGGNFYNEVFPSKQKNETVAPKIKPLFGTCKV